MIIGNRTFDRDHTYIFGILNVTPDSFYENSRCGSVDDALKRAEKLLNEGADVLDIGGESTRPGYQEVSDEEEMGRVIPVIEAIRSRFDMPISIDTYKSTVAKAAIDAGADLVNDIFGLEYDHKIADVIAETNASYCMMYQRERPYKDIMVEMMADMEETLEELAMKGVSNDRICIDPGIGFHKTYEENLAIVNNIGMLNQLGFPVLLGTSRKSFIGKTLNIGPEERLPGTLVTTVFAVLNGVNFVRVHDVKENLMAIKLAEELKNAK